MRLSTLLESSEKAQIFNDILDELTGITTLKEFRSFMSKHQHALSTTEVKKANGYADTVKEVLGKLRDLVKTEDDVVEFIKESFLYYFNEKEIEAAIGEIYGKFLESSLDFGEPGKNEVEFKQEEIKKWAMHPVNVNLMVKFHKDSVLTHIKNVAQTMEQPTVKFDFEKGGNFWDGRKAIQVSGNFIKHFVHVCYLARAFDKFEDDEDARKIITSSSGYRAYARAMKKEITKMLHITEADVYDEENKLFMDRHSLPDFFKALSDYICLLDDANEIGREIFAWFYHLPRHGQIHKDKQGFLDVYTEVMSRSNLFNFVKLESVFDSDGYLRELYYD